MTNCLDRDQAQHFVGPDLSPNCFPVVSAEETNRVRVKSGYCFTGVQGNAKWPHGDYAIPMSVYGCPDPDRTEWKQGYMNISFQQRTELFEMELGRISWHDASLDLLGPYGPYSFQLNFCHKANDAGNGTDADKRAWPSGQYYIYGTKSGCPQGKCLHTL